RALRPQRRHARGAARPRPGPGRAASARLTARGAGVATCLKLTSEELRLRSCRTVRDAARDHGTGIVGREEELALLRGRLIGERRASALVLVGGPGAGKTTLWEAAVELSRARRVRVLATRPSGAEVHLSFAGLIDLLEGVESEALASLQAPQRHAL